MGVFMSLALMPALALHCGPHRSDAAQVTEELPFRLSDAECENLLAVETLSMERRETFGPSTSQQARDALDPENADLSQYGVEIAVEQRFTNLLEREMHIEEAGASITPGGSEETYDTEYTFESPIVLGPGESQTVEFLITISASDVSPSYLLGLLEGTVDDMRVAPTVHIDVPNSDNCGYPEGIVVRAEEGVVEVQRPDPFEDAVSEVLGILLRVVANG